MKYVISDETMSPYLELVSDCCLMATIFLIYHGENMLIFNEMMMRSALY